MQQKSGKTCRVSDSPPNYGLISDNKESLITQLNPTLKFAYIKNNIRFGKNKNFNLNWKDPQNTHLKVN